MKGKLIGFVVFVTVWLFFWTLIHEFADPYWWIGFGGAAGVLTADIATAVAKYFDED